MHISVPRYNEFVGCSSTTEEAFFINGSVVCITLLDHDLLTYNDLAGQAYILLSKIPRIKTAPKKRLSQVNLPLVLPLSEQYQDIFQVFFTFTHYFFCFVSNKLETFYCIGEQ